MDGPAESLSEGRRPRDLALLLLAAGLDPPRERARDQQADRAGGDLRRRVLDEVAALDPEPIELPEVLAGVVASFGEPTGPTRAVCSQFLQEWSDAERTPALWEWLLAEALEHSERGPRRKGRGRRERAVSEEADRGNP